MEVLEIFLDALFREVLDLVDFVDVFRVILEGLVKEGSACTDSGYVSLGKNVLRGSGVLVSKV